MYIKYTKLKLRIYSSILLTMLITYIHIYSGNGSGTLDPSFGNQGIVITTIGGVDDELNSITLQSNGDIVGGGLAFITNYNDGAVLRYTPNGELDPTFGTGGITIQDLGGTYQINSVALQSSGKIITYGIQNNILVISRFNTNGSLDTTFATNGIFTHSPIEFINAMSVQPDDKILAGFQDDSFHPYVLRLTIDGALDSTFGTAGIASIGNDVGFTTGIGFQSSGNIILGGQFNALIAAARLLVSDGSLDPSFGTGGIASFNPPGINPSIECLVIQPDDEIVLAGNTTQTSPVEGVPLAVRLNSDGSLDSSFGTGGFSTPNVATNVIDAIGLQTNGQIILGGDDSNFLQFLLVRLNTDGSLDTTFGNNGQVVTIVVPNSNSPILSLIVIGNDYVIAEGTSIGDSTNEIVLAKYFLQPQSVVNNFSFSMTQASSLFVPAPGLLTTAIPSVFPVLLTPPQHGAVTIYPDGSFVYVPNIAFSGVDSFTYTLNVNGTISTTTGTVTITVMPQTSTSVGLGKLLVDAIRNKYGKKFWIIN